ncbi:hypothetical protein HAP48_0037090 [Bradyrhizobium septentrionale]|uniref:Uncharacterized protein n=1 Tax=Bradyrhizobium septentrionale TaxID=1404411 RepID=A0A974A1Q8_9BRAD|nr:hypothetical protein [Bradyrhizobium septentrionale]UGY14136.1 hypothetical protein HAP48_0037090 [Bradyrhizobium septentrionale]UGY22692.1 hypothetical protein HU675_0032590 [Bradyrhizobium septentrionale]
MTKEPPDRTACLFEESAAGQDPAAEAMVLNASDRPYRENAAAAGNDDGRGVDHGRGYKAAPPCRQEKLASGQTVQITGFHDAGTSR